VGFEAEFSALGVKVSSFEATATIRSYLTLSASRAYTLTKGIAYTTGPIEDTVILTTIPFDQYTYTVTSHPDPDLIGEKLVVSLPREPIDIQVERRRYNENVLEGGPVIDDTVLAHTLGDPSSYPTKAEKDELMKQYFGPIELPPLRENGPAAVGNSGGSTELSINVATEDTVGAALGLEVELAARGTVGTVILGFSVGFGVEGSLQVSHGSESEYSGSVSDMDVPNDEYGANGYSWGLFTYVHEDPLSGQAYEVINYWVE
jgi:hypothetical protein